MMVEFPGMRRNFILGVQYISDKEMQKVQWVKKSAKHFFWDNLRGKLDILDLLDNDSFKNAVDSIFRNQEEANIARQLAVTLDKTLDKIGIEQPDFVYLNSRLWDDVVEAAKHAYEVLMKDEDLDALLEAEEKRVVV
jgi:hypothetical protein